ncbi:MAG TPA: hypothetical protein VFS05_14615, partial [Gemmatimonadaceae bacterium]|nr:hypothetical protein [Gemmatimonadaceae bacterium]
AQLPDEEYLTIPGENTTGVMLAVYGGVIPGFSVHGTGTNDFVAIETDAAPSIGAQAGYGFSPSWLAYLNVDRSDHGTSDVDIIQSGKVTMHHIELGVRYNRHFMRDRLVGYANLGAGLRQFYSKQAVDLTSPSGQTTKIVLTARELAPGVGAQYFVSKRFAVDGDVQVGIGKFNRISYGGSGRQKFHGDSDASLRFRAGVAWYPTF